MSERRSGAGVAILNDYLYVCGGRNGNDALKSVERYSLSNGTWSTVKAMNVARCDPGVAVLNGKVYVIGGWCCRSPFDVESYDPNTDTWTKVASLSGLRTWGNTAAVYEGQIFSIGGYMESAVERYNANENKWRKCGSLICSRIFPAVKIVRNC